MKVAKIHLIYWAIIFFLLAVFLLCIAPGRVNDSAFENFSFASIIVSIVLAVVSIVYSFRSKSTTSESIAGIREIERNIDNKLNMFNTLEENISKDVQSAITEGVGKAIIELREDVGNLIDDQADIKQNLSKIVSDQKKYFEPDTSSSSQTLNLEAGKIFKNKLSYLGKVAMYLACLSYSKGKDFSFAALGDIMEEDMDYYWGFYCALSSCFPEFFDYEFKTPNTFIITKYNAENLGDIKIWKKAVSSNEDKQFANQYLEVLNNFFDNTAAEEQVS